MRRKLGALICLLAVAGASWAAARTSNGLAGGWEGSLQAGTIKLRVAMHLGKDQGGK